MNYKEFIDVVKEKMKEKIGKEEHIEQYETLKNNGVKRVGFVRRKPGVNISPTIYMEEFFEQYQDGISIAEIVEQILKIYEQVGDTLPIPVEETLEYHKIKQKIAYKLIDKDMNSELLKQVPYDIFENFAVVPYVMFEKTDLGIATLQVRNEHLKKWGVDAEEVLTQAVQNTHKILPAEIGRLTEFMYIMTNSKAHFGAATILYPNTLHKIAEELKENFYILPSSIHEVIIVPESYGVYPDKLCEIVKEINTIEVITEEILSNSVYYYCDQEHRIITYSE